MARTSFAISLTLWAALPTLAVQPAAAATEYVPWAFVHTYDGYPEGKLRIHGPSLYGTASGSTYGNGQAFRLYGSRDTLKIKTVAALGSTAARRALKLL